MVIFCKAKSTKKDCYQFFVKQSLIKIYEKPNRTYFITYKKLLQIILYYTYFC